MKTSSFLYTNSGKILNSGKVSWKSPSNIALVKYWGKMDLQIPKNPSLSFTLGASYTQTALLYKPVGNTDLEKTFEIYLDEVEKEDFKPKITSFFKRIEKYVPFINDYSFVINTHNSFPHSSGIASSASSMSALALCVMSMERMLNNEMSDDYFYQKASFLARLGSGSAARSVKGAIVVWGEHDTIPDSSDTYGVVFPYKVHSIFKNYQDTILLVDKGQKQVSSTVGHGLMKNHPFAEQRFLQANTNLTKLIEILQNGDIKSFIEIVESEALTLHAMMLTSNPYFILMHPNTLTIINKIWKYREETGSHICFTLDAGANVHVLYPVREKNKIKSFIDNELASYCQDNQYINDEVGLGAIKLS